jgi:hypothetical protein
MLYVTLIKLCFTQKSIAVSHISKEILSRCSYFTVSSESYLSDSYLCPSTTKVTKYITYAHYEQLYYCIAEIDRR